MQRYFVLHALRVSFSSIAVVMVVVLIGCGKPMGTVNGKVTYKGIALKGGNVVFQGEQTYSMPIGEDGTYSSPSMYGGPYKVCVETASLKSKGGMGSSKDKTAAKIDSDANIPPGYTPSSPDLANKNAGNYVQIPSKYAKPETTDITLEVKAGSQSFNIELK
jgi:hypothetical protein